MHLFNADELQDLFTAGGGGKGVRCVFVSACHSASVGKVQTPHHRTTLNHFASLLVVLLLTTPRAVLSQAFEAAGVDHVVAVRTDAEVLDKAAIMFAKQFYEGLVVSA